MGLPDLSLRGFFRGPEPDIVEQVIQDHQAAMRQQQAMMAQAANRPDLNQLHDADRYQQRYLQQYGVASTSSIPEIPEPPHERVPMPEMLAAVLKLRHFQSGGYYSRWRGPPSDRMYMVCLFGSSYPVFVYAEKHNKWYLNADVFDSTTYPVPEEMQPVTWMFTHDLNKLVQMGLMDFLVHKTGEKFP